MIKKKYADGSATDSLDQTRQITIDVAKQIGERIGNTLGPGGRNYMTPDGITNDGVSILNHIRFEDERADAVADAFVEVARRQDDDAGDGTTTATLLTTELTKLVLADVPDINVPSKTTVMSLKKKLEEECKAAVELLSQEKNDEVTLEELKNVTRTAMEGHESSDLIAETVFEVGYNSNTSIMEGFNGEVTNEVVPGVHMPLKIETPAMYTNQARKEAVYDNPIVLVVNHVFEKYTDLSNFFSTMIAKKKEAASSGDGSPQPIIIVGKHFSVQFTAQVVNVSRQLGLPILLLNANDLRPEEFQDIAEYCDAKYIDTHPKEGSKVEEIAFEDAGGAKRVIAGPKQTSFVDGLGIEAGRVSTRIAELTSLAEKEQSSLERDLLKRRAAGLDGGVATLFVDAKTAVDRYYLKKKVEDAVNSAKAAMEFGTLPGGGISLSAVALKLDSSSYLSRVLPEVYNRIQKAAGGDLEIDETVVRDAFYTNKCAIENAVAVVKILTTMEGVIADVDRDLTNDLARKLGLE